MLTSPWGGVVGCDSNGALASWLAYLAYRANAVCVACDVVVVSTLLSTIKLKRISSCQMLRCACFRCLRSCLMFSLAEERCKPQWYRIRTHKKD